MKRKFDSMKHCGANRRSGGLCVHGKGFGTDHSGSGRCKYHGGGGKGKPSGRPPTHGRYSKITRPRIKELIEQFSEDPDPMNLEPEVILLRALTQDFVERYDGFIDGLLSWNASFSSGIQSLVTTRDPAALLRAREQIRASMNQRPTQVLDVSAASVLVDRLGKMVERIHKIKTEGAITIEAMSKVMERLGLVVAKHVDSETAAKIDREWLEIQI